ncbi:MAG: IclR family transcriptional regulator [Clostridiaceae bacterium]|jgi:DNA-binding IclR family transcriptional regulator|nr:IclR family transcriptional regulator [Clostridiaceae bacterium]
MIQSLVRAIDILEVLKDSDKSFSVAEISEASQLPSSTVHRILQTLSYKNYVIKNEETHLYQIGSGLIPLGMAAIHHTKLNDVAPAIVKKLADLTSEDAYLVIRAGYKGYVIEKEEGPTNLKFIEKSGAEIDLHCGAIRKSLLAYQSDDFINEFIKNGLKQHTNNTTIDGEKLLLDLDKIRKEGIAVTYGDYIEGACGVGAPVFDFNNKAVASIGVILPDFRINEESLSKLKASVLQCSRELSSLLGCKRVL